MKVLQWLQSNPDAVALILGTIGAWFGAKRVAKAKTVALAEVDRWANAAAAAITKVAEATSDHDAAALAAKAMGFLRALAAGAGVKLTEAQEDRARSIIVEGLNHYQNVASEAAAKKLGGAARELLRNLERLEKLQGGGLSR